ncbi:DNRLRE domain-containing protein [Kribbella sp. NPDC050459]|uniref:DNRLRE domain-containing protein n=1 Tax=Kribbella sp. NPDC050459 TaxID=3155785 RepID=UPI00340C3E56
MRRARRLLTSALVLSLPASLGVPATALAHPQQVAQVAVPQVARAAVGPLAAPAPARVLNASTTAAASGKPTRVRELEERRTTSSTSYRMSDGTTQVELSTEPVHYKDSKGKWQDIDTKVTAGTGADSFENAKNNFRTRFGKSSDRLLTFESDGESIGLGAAGEKRALTPVVKDSSVAFPDVFGTADVRYYVSRTGVKETVVLTAPADAADEYKFELHTSGLIAKAQPDGSIGFFKKNDDERPKYVIPAPNMYDSSAQNQLGQPGYSDKITQTISQQGGKTLLILKPDQSWLAAKERVYPIVIDPTIVVVPDPTAAQDTSISQANASTPYGTNPTVLVGDDASHNTWRGLVKFDTSMIPAGTTIRSADLNMHYGATFGSDTTTLPFVALKANKAWTETTATWASMNTSFDGSYAVNRVVVDDQDTLSTSYEGLWEDQSNANAVNGWLSYAPNGTTPDAFTWDARVPSAGDYLVEGHYFQASYRGSPTVTITGDDPSAPLTTPWNQTTGSATGAWYSFGTVHTAPDKTARVRMVRDTSSATTPIADAVRWTRYSTQTKQPGQRDLWHSFALGTFVQSWVDTPASNNGVMLKLVDDVTAPPVGGLYYSASETAYGDETAARPNLVVTYDEPGVTLNAPTTIHASGPELTWSKYVDPTTSESDNLVEYQIFRGCQALPGGKCTNPVGEYFHNANPQDLTLVGTVAPDVTSWTDQSAKPSAVSANNPDPATYNYWVVARTVADQAKPQNGRAASNVQTVTMPREGRIVRSFSGDPVTGIPDTTLSSLKPDDNLPRPDGVAANTRFWMQVGNNHPTYGDERAVFKFDTAAVTQGTQVTDARVELFSNYGSGSGQADFDLHALTRDFAEDSATWKQAASTINWTAAGGDYDATTLASVRPDDNAQRLTFAKQELTDKIQAWVADPGANHGFLLKTRDEAASQQLLSITNSESPDALFRPRLWVESLVKNDAQAYEADQLPERFAPNTTITTPVTVTNTSNADWPAGLRLSYRWADPETGEDLTVEGDRLEKPLQKALARGESEIVDLPVRAPIQSDTGTKRMLYDLFLDLRWNNPGNNNALEWFSATHPPSANITPPTQGCAVVKSGLQCVERYVEDQDPSSRLGLEKFLSYTGEETGGGPQLLTNLFSGNVVWSYDAISDRSIGPSAFVRLAYNSMDGGDSGAGYGVSVQASTLTRLGSKLSVPSGQGGEPNEMSFVDGDGTTQLYKIASQTTEETIYRRPPGVALDLRRDKSADADEAHEWVFSRPDGTRFFFNGDTGLQTSVVDRNGNTMTFEYDAARRLTAVRDATRQDPVLTLGYAGSDTHIAWIRDLSGRALKFTYNATQQLVKLEDGGPFTAATASFDAGAQVKTFLLGYTEQSTNSNAKLNSIKDPRNAETRIEYYTSTETSTYALWPKRYTDRRNNDTTFSYDGPDQASKERGATVTDVNGSTPSVTTYRMDPFGRTTSIKDANVNAAGGAETTKLGWDRDHNVVRLEEPNGAVSTWEYDPNTGYPLKVRDAMAVKAGLAGVVMKYTTLTTGTRPTVLDSKTSAAGRIDSFTYDANGNLKTVKNGLGYGPAYTYNDNGTLATVTDARNGLTKYENYDANGYPQSITEPELATTLFTYDTRGNVVRVVDAQTRETKAEYDAFGRPTKITTPYNGVETRTTETAYDLNDNVTKETAPNGASTSYAFDAADNLLTKTLPDNNATGRQIAYTYDVLGRKITETAPKGVATTADPNDFVTKYSYDRVGQVLKVETPFVDTDGSTKTPTTTYEYDLVGNQITVIDPVKNASAATDFTSKTVYDLNHRPTAVTDAAGYTSKTEYDADGLATAEITALGHRKSTDYDEAGQPVAVHVPRTKIGEHQKDLVTRTAYDEAGNVTRQTLPSGLYSETVYDKNNRPIQKKSAFNTATALYKTPSSTFIQYYPTGELMAQSEPTFGTSGTQWTNFTYYGSGDIKTSTDPWQITTSYSYNQIGQQTNRTLTVPGDDAKRTQAWGYYLDGSLQSRSDTASQQPVDVVDNADTWETSSTGTWAPATGGTNTQGNDYRTHAAAAAGTPEASDTFNWRVLPDVAGSFDVYASCPVRTDASTSATYTINHSTGAATKTVDQKACTAATPWVNLGNYSFPNGVAKTITLNPATTGVVSADAIKLVSTNPVESRSFTYTYDLNGQQTEIKDNNANALTDTFKVSTDGLARTTQVQELKAGQELAKTDYTYDLNSNILSTYAQRPQGANNLLVKRYTAYTWDARNLVDTVKAGDTPTGTLDTWTYTYDPRGLRSTITKPNGNVTTQTYHEDGLLRTLVEKTSAAKGNQLVSSHSLKYTDDGDREVDTERLDQPGSSNYLDQASAYVYTPARKLERITRTGVEKGDNEYYEYDAAGNIKKQTIGATTSTMTYDRNRLVKTVTGSTTMNHRYDVFGRSTTTDVGSQVVEQNGYDGYDRLIRQQKFDTAGTATFTRNQTYDPFDRTSSQSEKVGTAQSISTRYTFIGLDDQVAAEEQKDSTGTYEVSKAYAYGASGENLSLVDTPVNASTTKKVFYGVNPHGDVESLTDASTGLTTSTYRYTAYGQADKTGTTGDDTITGTPSTDADVVNPYRFNGKRFDGATGTYDMGFREYNPSLNRFLTRDLYDGALKDMSLGGDPWNMNRYAFAGGNPISRVEYDGHFSLGGLVSSVGDAVDKVGDAATTVSDAVSEASSAVGDFVVEHKATIAGVATGIAVGAGCMAATGGAGSVGCAALAGAAGSAVQNALDEKADHSVGGYAKSMAGGAAINVATLGAGKLLAPVASKLAAPLKTAAGNATGKIASTARSAISKFKGGCSSFSGATVVLMADGTEKAIEAIEPGDKVLATDPDTGEQVAKEVTNVWVHGDTLIDLVIDGESITTTEDHPFYNATDGDFQWAAEIDPGDKVLTDDGRLVTVLGLDITTARNALAYNLTVQGIHTYHVGQHHILVHNANADEVCTVGANGALRNSLGRFAKNPNKPPAPAKSSVHGNSRASTALNYLYRLEDKNGNLLKWGITNDLARRYSQTFLKDKQLIPMTSGTRDEMLNLERWIIERDAGPLNQDRFLRNLPL